MQLFSDELIFEACKARHVEDLSHASIGETLLVALYLQEKTGIPIVRMDQGSPGLEANKYGREAEKAAIDAGLGAKYPAAAGVPELKDAASRFVKAFMDIDINPLGCIPTVGSVQASFGSFIACCQRIPGKNKVLFLDPGFPIQKSQLRVLGIEWKSFDIAPFRGEALAGRIEEELAPGDVAAIIYSNPNNPAWICLEESELQAIGALATKYDVVVLEDLAYFCMDSRKDLRHPFKAPFLPTVARYTDNYILLLSASKIFSYAGQRIALCCVGDRLFEKKYPSLAERYQDSGVFGQSLIASILYNITSGCTATTQYGYAKMLELSCDGVIDFVEDTKAYACRARKMKEIFTSHGFTITYDKDVSQNIGDGFFFTLSYEGMSSGELAIELMKYGVSSISLSTTGAGRNGVRACTSSVSEETYPILEQRMAEFEKDHSR